MTGLQWDWQGTLEISGGALLLMIWLLGLAAAYRRLWRRSALRYLLVAIASLVASLALAALFNPPQWHQAGTGRVLVTEGGGLDGVDGEAYSTTDFDSAAGDIRRLLHAGQLPLRETGISRLEIRGHGLRPAEADALRGRLAVDFSPPDLEGIVEVHWPRDISVGGLARISGRYVSPVDDLGTLTLEDPAGAIVASQPLKPGESFDLAFRPRATGLAHYRLSLKRGEQSLITEEVMLEVHAGRPMNLMVQQSAPSFDVRQLRRWAGDHGSRVWVKTEISQDRWLIQSTNAGDDRGEAGLTLPFLSGLDLLVMDGRSWAGLSADVRERVAEAVEQGLGLLLLVDADLAESFDTSRDGLLRAFDLTLVPDEASEALPVLTGLRIETGLPVAPVRIANRGGHVLVRSDSGEALDTWAAHGAGRVGLTRLRERHRWVTSGDQALYSAYWNLVLRTLARPRAAPYLLGQDDDVIAEPLGRVSLCAMNDGRPLRFELTDPDGESFGLAVTADPLEGPVACAWFWPRTPGWHRIELQDGDTAESLDRAHFHVYGEHNWRAAAWLGRQRATRSVFSSATHSMERTGNEDEGPLLTRPLHPAWPWLLFVIFAAILWIERRLDSPGARQEGTTSDQVA